MQKGAPRDRVDPLGYSLKGVELAGVAEGFTITISWAVNLHGSLAACLEVRGRGKLVACAL